MCVYTSNEQLEMKAKTSNWISDPCVYIIYIECLLSTSVYICLIALCGALQCNVDQEWWEQTFLRTVLGESIQLDNIKYDVSMEFL